ncbi:hypothetical protein CI102_7175 [Trichoderma harzianum]|nr:hypothetical protein CI102_7175 [Trichoderma harzianum]
MMLGIGREWEYFIYGEEQKILSFLRYLTWQSIHFWGRTVNRFMIMCVKLIDYLCLLMIMRISLIDTISYAILRIFSNLQDYEYGHFILTLGG